MNNDSNTTTVDHTPTANKSDHMITKQKNLLDPSPVQNPMTPSRQHTPPPTLILSPSVVKDRKSSKTMRLFKIRNSPHTRSRSILSSHPHLSRKRSMSSPSILSPAAFYNARSPSKTPTPPPQLNLPLKIIKRQHNSLLIHNKSVHSSSPLQHSSTTTSSSSTSLSSNVKKKLSSTVSTSSTTSTASTASSYSNTKVNRLPLWILTHFKTQPKGYLGSYYHNSTLTPTSRKTSDSQVSFYSDSTRTNSPEVRAYKKIMLERQVKTSLVSP